MARAMNLGMPRIGPDRELKRVVEAYWEGHLDASALAHAAAERRAHGWLEQASAGVDLIPSNDFSLYDQVLDTCCVVGAVPPRFGPWSSSVGLDTYFAMARGADRPEGPVAPLAMTKWFDTNYHYLVPELGPATVFRRGSTKPLDEYAEARRLGIVTRPVLVGPVTFLMLAKPAQAGFATLELLPRLLPIYQEVLAELAQAGCPWVQLDEPVLVTDLDPSAKRAFMLAYATLLDGDRPRCLVATYFGDLGDNTDLAITLPVDGLHVDLVRGPDQLPPLLERIGDDQVLSAGVVDGRNVWRNDLRTTLSQLGPAQQRLGDRLWVGPSCSLQHVPHDLDLEVGLDAAVRGWLAFARQKLAELTALARGLSEGPDVIASELAESDQAGADRARSPRNRSDAVRRRSESSASAPARRPATAGERQQRRQAQCELTLPILPTTTIGSFPQTAEIRRTRQQHASGHLSDEDYARFCAHEIERVIRLQESIGLDVLVHGEPERNDMVQYFGEQLHGFCTTAHGWVQSYGTRCVRPPVLYGDVSRPHPMTVAWLRSAQSLTAAPVKGMLTGPVTILQWSFVRDDQPRSVTCRQIAWAIADEVADIEAAGIGIIQVDEPALREGMPMRLGARADYLDWATDCFRLATAGVDDTTQIHTHMCYAEFGDILPAIVSLDADVISLEAARSGMGVLDNLTAVDLAGVGPGVYDIHSPHVPTVEEMGALIDRALEVIPAERLWINPDCGLKTRGWEAVEPALRNMVAAARRARSRLAGDVTSTLAGRR
jgi:5-methyltetrahydropteroyltriglutamate--homocysteine methyltransferase